MGIITILIVLIAPAVGGLVRSPLLTQSADAIVGLLNQARQTATARNAPVEVRFYQYGDPSVPGESAANAASGKYRAMQLYLVNDNGKGTPLAAVVNFPNGIIADNDPTFSSPDTTFSSLLDASSPRLKAWTIDTQVALPRANTYICCFCRFRPDGSTDLAPNSNWFITLHNVVDHNGVDNSTGKKRPPPNYVTIQVDPLNGETTVYRP